MPRRGKRDEGRVEAPTQEQEERCPAWAEDAWNGMCLSCAREFTLLRRRHHCRNCGNIFCNECSVGRRALPDLGYPGKVRVCNTCTQLLADGAAQGLPGLRFDNPQYRTSPPAYVSVPERVWPGTAQDAETLEEAALRAYERWLRDPETFGYRNTSFDQTPLLAVLQGTWFRAPTTREFVSPISPRRDAPGSDDSDGIMLAAASDEHRDDAHAREESPVFARAPEVQLGPWQVRVAIVRLHVPRGTAAAAHKPGVRSCVMTFVSQDGSKSPPLALLGPEDEPVLDEEQEVDPTSLPPALWTANAHLFTAMTPRLPAARPGAAAVAAAAESASAAAMSSTAGATATASTASAGASPRRRRASSPAAPRRSSTSSRRRSASPAVSSASRQRASSSTSRMSMPIADEVLRALPMPEVAARAMGTVDS